MLDLVCTLLVLLVDSSVTRFVLFCFLFLITCLVVTLLLVSHRELLVRGANIVQTKDDCLSWHVYSTLDSQSVLVKTAVAPSEFHRDLVPELIKLLLVRVEVVWADLVKWFVSEL